MTPREPRHARRGRFAVRTVAVPRGLERALAGIWTRAICVLREAWNVEASSSLATIGYVIHDAKAKTLPAAPGVGRAWEDFGTRVKVRLNNELTATLPKELSNFGRRMYAEQEPKIKKVLGIPAAIIVLGGQAVINGFVRTNVDKIVSVCSERVDKATEILRANPNLHVKDLAAALLDSAEGNEARAELWARDQTLKLNGQIADAQAIGAGAKRYRWRATGGASGDGRTRDDHKLLDGHIFRYDTPPVTNASEVAKGKPARRNNPHGDFQCRCEAEAIFDYEAPDYWETFDGFEFVRQQFGAP